jgi:hypothetical protein
MLQGYNRLRVSAVIRRMRALEAERVSDAIIGVPGKQARSSLRR